MGKHDRTDSEEIVAAISPDAYYEARVKELENRLALSEETNLKLAAEVAHYRDEVNNVIESARTTVEKLRAENSNLRAKLVKLVETYV